ncbi:MAG TPA: hypothetical protein ENK14_05480 [Caldithrix sp.]|nr:hypothetical protein [Caldithrix sp.]
MQFSQTIRKTFTLYAAQIINLFLGWVVAKFNVSYLSVTEYGQFSFFITAINIGYVFFTFGIFESASRLVALSKSEYDYRKLFGATISFSLICYLIFSLLFWISHWFIDSFFQVPIANLIKFLFPLAGVYLINNMWQLLFRGVGKIKELSWYLILPRVVYIISLIGLVVFGKFTLFGTTFFNLFSLAVIILIFSFRARPVFFQLKESARQMMAEIRRFGVHVYWGEIIKVFLYHTDKVLISFFMNAESLAYYSLAFTITFPLSFFSNALSTAFYKKFSTSKKIESRVLLFNILWVLVTVVLFILFRKWIVLRLFSAKYATSLTVFPVLAVAFGIGSLSKLYSFYLTAQGAGRAIRNISAATLVFHVVLNLLLIPRYGIMGAATTSLCTYIVDLLLSYYYYLRHRRTVE